MLRRLPTTLLAAAAVAVVLILSSQPVGAEDGGAAHRIAPTAITAFRGMAAADGLRVHLTVPRAPISNDVLDVSGPTAHATMDAVGTIQGFASFPDPGSNARAIPSTVALGLAGNGFPLPFPLPDYPLMVSSEYPDRQKAYLDAGPYRLEATSSADQATGTATAGFLSSDTAAGGVTSANSEIKRSGDKIVSSATSSVQGLKIGPLTVADVRSAASVTLSEDGTLARSSSLQVVGANVGNTTIALGPEAFVIGDSAVPVPARQTLEALNTALKPAGILLNVAPQRSTENGVVAPTLEIAVASVDGGSAPSAEISIGSASATLQAVGAGASGDSSSQDPVTSTGDWPTPSTTPAVSQQTGVNPLIPSDSSGTESSADGLNDRTRGAPNSEASGPRAPGTYGSAAGSLPPGPQPATHPERRPKTAAAPLAPVSRLWKMPDLRALYAGAVLAIVMTLGGIQVFRRAGSGRS